MTGTNPVGAWLLSNFTTQDPTVYKSAIDGNFAVAQRMAANFAPRQAATPAMTVTLEQGHIFNGSSLTEIAAQTTGTITAPTANPRIDRIVVDNFTGAVSIVTGTENASPTPPLIPAGKSPVAQVRLQTSSTTITNAMITDERDLTGLSSRFKVVSFTRDVSLASSNQSISGIGWRPKAVLISGGVNGTSAVSWGFSDGSSNCCVYDNNAAAAGTYGVNTGAAIITEVTVSNVYSGAITMDPDGFTVAWTKTGLSTGISTMNAFCMG